MYGDCKRLHYVSAYLQNLSANPFQLITARFVHNTITNARALINLLECWNAIISLLCILTKDFRRKYFVLLFKFNLLFNLYRYSRLEIRSTSEKGDETPKNKNWR